MVKLNQPIKQTGSAVTKIKCCRNKIVFLRNLVSVPWRPLVCSTYLSNNRQAHDASGSNSARTCGLDYLTEIYTLHNSKTSCLCNFSISRLQIWLNKLRNVQKLRKVDCSTQRGNQQILEWCEEYSGAPKFAPTSFLLSLRLYSSLNCAVRAVPTSRRASSPSTELMVTVSTFSSRPSASMDTFSVSDIAGKIEGCDFPEHRLCGDWHRYSKALITPAMNVVTSSPPSA